MSADNLGYRIFSRVVHNDAMRSDPPEIYGWRALVLAMSAGWGAMLFGMDSSMISGVVVLPAFLRYVCNLVDWDLCMSDTVPVVLALIKQTAPSSLPTSKPT